jgi:hypothetical protein
VDNFLLWFFRAAIFVVLSLLITLLVGCSNVNPIGIPEDPNSIPSNYELGGREPCLNELSEFKQTTGTQHELGQDPFIKKISSDGASTLKTKTLTIDVSPVDVKSKPPLTKKNSLINSLYFAKFVDLVSLTNIPNLKLKICCDDIHTNKNAPLTISVVPQSCKSFSNPFETCSKLRNKKRKFQECVRKDTSIIVNPFLRYRK